MAHEQVLFRSEAREKILRGASALADAVRVIAVGVRGSITSPLRNRVATKRGPHR